MSASDSRLTLGSGTHYAEGWCNFDLYTPGPGFQDPDVFGSVFEMPFESGRFTDVYMGHFLEHLEWDAIGAALAEVRRVAAPGARIVAVGPCIELAIKTHQPWEILEAIVAHWGGMPGAGHAWTPTAMLTLLAMQRVFPDAYEVPITDVDRPEWPNPTTANWQCAVMAVR